MAVLCHSEQSEESLDVSLCSGLEQNSEMFASLSIAHPISSVVRSGSQHQFKAARTHTPSSPSKRPPNSPFSLRIVPAHLPACVRSWRKRELTSTRWRPPIPSIILLYAWS